MYEDAKEVLATEAREMQAVQHTANELVHDCQNIIERLSSLRSRLLGEAEAVGPEAESPQPVRAEIPELHHTLRTAGKKLEQIHTLIGRLESI